jgi:hypothetical protein
MIKNSKTSPARRKAALCSSDLFGAIVSAMSAPIYYSVTELSFRTGFKARKVRNVLHKMESVGLIEVYTSGLTGKRLELWKLPQTQPNAQLRDAAQAQPQTLSTNE